MNCKLLSIMMKSGNVRQVSKKNRNGTRIGVLIKYFVCLYFNITGLLTGTGGATLT